MEIIINLKIIETVNAYKEKKCNISLKIHLVDSHFEYFPENLGGMKDEDGEWFYQDIAILENTDFLTDYIW